MQKWKKSMALLGLNSFLDILWAKQQAIEWYIYLAEIFWTKYAHLTNLFEIESDVFDNKWGKMAFEEKNSCYGENFERVCKKYFHRYGTLFLLNWFILPVNSYFNVNNALKVHFLIY